MTVEAARAILCTIVFICRSFIDQKLVQHQMTHLTAHTHVPCADEGKSVSMLSQTAITPSLPSLPTVDLFVAAG